MPARRNVCSSRPLPGTILPRKSSPSRVKAAMLRSTTATWCPSLSRRRARNEPTRPQPTMTTFMSRMLYALPAETHTARRAAVRSVVQRLPEHDGPAGGRLEHVGRGLAHVELTEALAVGHADDDQVGLPLPGLVDDRRAGFARLEEL